MMIDIALVVIILIIMLLVYMFIRRLEKFTDISAPGAENRSMSISTAIVDDRLDFYKAEDEFYRRYKTSMT